MAVAPLLLAMAEGRECQALPQLAEARARQAEPCAAALRARPAGSGTTAANSVAGRWEASGVSRLVGLNRAPNNLEVSAAPSKACRERVRGPGLARQAEQWPYPDD